MGKIQQFTAQEKNKRILKSVVINFLWAGLILAFALLMVWEYKTRGYVSVKYHRFYGEEAKEIAWLSLFAALSMFIYSALLTIKNLKSKSSKDKYFKEIVESKQLICADCLEVNDLKINQESICPHCGSGAIEELQGFFKRHSEKIIDDNEVNTMFVANNGQENSKKFLGLAIFFALLCPTFIGYIVYILIINPRE